MEEMFMIFYFSGTGNSLYAAEKLHDVEGGKLINISDALNEKQFKYKVNEGENIGIIFPVYFFGLPTIVSEFISQLTIENNDKPFVYTVITCGSSIGNAGKMLAKQLKQRDIQLNSIFSIEMPSNYVMMFDVNDKQKQDSSLKSAENEIDDIVELLKDNKKGDFSNHGHLAPLTPIAYMLYGIYRKTKNFYADDKCNNCGLCEKICPSKTIKITSNKPNWIKEKCSHCTACINRCPTQAIQYSNSTKKRGRYINPNVKFSDA
jgi:NAD-dependent dihydropyrimidine dehydrogenase PreA subunit